jgi:hypothetical protein
VEGRRHAEERQVGSANRPVMAVYRPLPALYDALVGPCLRAVAFTSEPSDGNAFARR